MLLAGQLGHLFRIVRILEHLDQVSMTMIAETGLFQVILCAGHQITGSGTIQSREQHMPPHSH